MRAEYVESALLTSSGFRHAFFTRRGGVSEGPYASLSFSVAVGDDPERGRKNLELAGALLGVAGDRVYFLSQVHGSAAHVLSGGEPRERVVELEGDALASRDPTLACGVRSADCVPILAADVETGAVVAIHAGWRGVVRGVVEAGIATLRGLGGECGTLVAAIGPHIREEVFEVGEDVARQLERASPVSGVVDRSRAKPHVSLARIVRGKLVHAGLLPERIDDVGGCTASEPERFFSFRRGGRASGRHLSAIVARLP